MSFKCSHIEAISSDMQRIKYTNEQFSVSVIQKSLKENLLFCKDCDATLPTVWLCMNVKII